jgi:hypothetical protein
MGNDMVVRNDATVFLPYHTSPCPTLSSPHLYNASLRLFDHLSEARRKSIVQC